MYSTVLALCSNRFLANVNALENIYNPYILPVKLANCLSIVESKSDLQILLSIPFFWLFVSRMSLLGCLLVEFEGPSQRQNGKTEWIPSCFYPGPTRQGLKYMLPKSWGHKDDNV